LFILRVIETSPGEMLSSAERRWQMGLP